MNIFGKRKNCAKCGVAMNKGKEKLASHTSRNIVEWKWVSKTEYNPTLQMHVTSSNMEPVNKQVIDKNYKTYYMCPRCGRMHVETRTVRGQ